MRHTLSIREEAYDALRTHLFGRGDDERAAYLFCNVSTTESETRLLASEWRPVADDHIDWSSRTGLQIDAKSYRSAMKDADRKKQRLVFVHSHPDDRPEHSPQDNSEEGDLFSSAYNRIHNAGPHGSLVLTRPGSIVGRIWHEDGTCQALDMVRILGLRYRFVTTNSSAEPLPDFFDRQVRAFGEDVQRLFGSLHVGIVGVGGTGSSVFEQLVRLGVGHITVADGDRFDPSNVTRVYGSASKDKKMAKVAIAQRNASHPTCTAACRRSLSATDPSAVPWCYNSRHVSL